MSKRNVSYIKPDDPSFIKQLKKQAGYDDTNHKFDELQNAEGDFADDDDSEQPQVVVLTSGDLTAEEAEVERIKHEKQEDETKADLTQRVIFKSKTKLEGANAKKRPSEDSKNKEKKKSKPILSFDDEEEEEEDD